ncbi:MAG: hypothetical protein DKM24_01070 [Candidatus Melainabacteria bacterium]|nr:MAG: hypothetical protein DKM24_01070 [Candidatus Melainabacteria bacterium]
MARVVQKSFNGGEITPAIHARNNLQKYESSLARLKNGFVHIEGCVSNRQGTEFVTVGKYPQKKIRLIPFKFNNEQTYMIEAGDKYFRFIQNGGVVVYPDNFEEEEKRGLPVEVETPYSEDDLDKLQWAQNADVMTLCCYPQKEVYELSRLSHYDWALTQLVITPEISAPTNLAVSWHGSLDSPRDYSYCVTAVKKDSYEESIRSEVVTVQGEIEAKWGVEEYFTLNWAAVEDAVEYNIYRSVNGVYGFIGTSETNSFKDIKYEPDLSCTAPIFKNPFANGNCPATTTWFQQRRFFGRFPDAPSKFIATQLGTNKNFNISRPLIASDAITINLSDNGVNTIKHLIGMKKNLIIFTDEAVWSSKGSDGTYSASPLPENEIEAYIGSSDVKPVVTGRMIIFVHAGGQMLSDLGYTWASDSYDTTKLSVWAQHLFEGKNVVQMDYSEEPYHQLFVIENDGTANCLVYDKAQEVIGWGQYITKGQYEDAKCIREGKENIVYFVVERIINNVTKKFIERQPSRIPKDVSGGCYSDCSLRYSGKATSHVTGLEHLEGEKVSINADGGHYEGVVVNGSIDLEIEAKNIVVGLPYEFILKTLNIEAENTHGLKKVVTKCDIGIYKSREDFKVLTEGVRPYECLRSNESINNDEHLITGIVEAYPHSDYTTNASVTIIQDKTLPLTITSIATVLSVQEEPTDEQG